MSETSEKRLEKVRFMNMCMIQDGRGNVLALDKVNDSYTWNDLSGWSCGTGRIIFSVYDPGGLGGNGTYDRKSGISRAVPLA